jgi:hypothetical protein
MSRSPSIYESIHLFSQLFLTHAHALTGVYNLCIDIPPSLRQQQQQQLSVGLNCVDVETDVCRLELLKSTPPAELLTVGAEIPLGVSIV